MGFAVPADAYDRLMGRYSAPLAPQLVRFAALEPGARVLDVGCGPGALLAELGGHEVSAVDPSESFVAAARERFPHADVRQGAAEDLPFPDASFDAALAQLVVHFMADPARGIAEMARVTRPGGTVCACVWDHGGDRGPLSPFWRVARELDPGVAGESELAGAREGHLAELLRGAGLQDVEDTALEVRVEHASFAAWWEPFTRGVGRTGDYLAQLDDDHRRRLEAACRERLGDGPLAIAAFAWAARGRR